MFLTGASEENKSCLCRWMFPVRHCLPVRAERKYSMIILHSDADEEKTVMKKFRVGVVIRIMRNGRCLAERNFPPVSLREGLRMMIPGIYAAMSARHQGGKLLEIKYP